MKRMIDEKLIEWAKQMLEVISINENDEVVISNLYVSSRINVEELKLNGGIGSIYDDNDDQIFPNGVPTQLFKHTITAGSSLGYVLKLITTSDEAIDFSTFAEQADLADYLAEIDVISFTREGLLLVFDGSYYGTLSSSSGTMTFNPLDDWESTDFTSSTDVVVPL